jgi:hypothetical protein
MATAYRRNKGRYGWLLFFLFVNTWVISSWWMWFYGGSYGHRAFIDLYPFFAIGIAAALHRGFGPIGSRALAIIAMLFIPLQLVQTFQYNKHIIPFDNMSKAKFWNLFLRTGNDLAWYYSGYEGEDAYVGLDSLVVSHSMEQEMGWGNEQQFTGTEQHEGARSAVMLPADEYGITMRKNYSELGVDRNVIRVSAWVNADSRTTNIGFVCSLEDSTGNSYYWKKYPLRPQFSGRNEWSRATAVFKCGNPRNASDRVVVYPMKSDDATVYLDEMEVSFIRAR